MRTKLLRVFAFLLATATFSLDALANCNDIKAACSRSYNLDTAACERNYRGQQNADCHKRAAQQLVYCVKASGC